MANYSRVDETYYTDNDRHMLKYMRDIWEQSITVQQAYWTEADVDTRFLAGDQQIWRQLYGALPFPNRKQFNFNRIRRIINMISGFQRRNRKSIICVPQEGADEATASDYSALLLWAHNRGNVLNAISDAFENALITGMSLVSTWMDYRSDIANPDICVDVLPYNAFLMDPWVRKWATLEDCNYIWTRKYLSKKQVKSLLPGREEEIDKLPMENGRDDKFWFLPEVYNTNRRYLLNYDEFWYLDTRMANILVDMSSGETLEWQGENDETLKDYLQRWPNVRVIKQEKQTVKLAIVVQNKVFFNGLNPMGVDCYPHVPVVAYYQSELPYYPLRIQGVIRSLRDSQYLYNRRRIIELQMLEARATSSLKIMEGTLVDDNDAFLTNPGRAYFVKKDSPMGLDGIQPMPDPQVPPSMLQLSELLGQEIQQISGVNEELLGMADDDKAGILSMLRQGAGLTTLQKLFDQLDLSMKQIGLLHIKLMQANWSPGKVQRILNKEPADEFYHKHFAKYDCVIEEGADLPNQRQMAFLQKMQLKQLGIPIPTESLLEDITMQNKKEYIDKILQQEQSQAQMQQQQQQLEMHKIAVETESAKSYAASQQALAAERMNKVQLDAALSAERISRAQEDKDEATLARIKAAKELADMDLSQLQKLIDIVNSLEGKEQKNTQ